MAIFTAIFSAAAWLFSGTLLANLALGALSFGLQLGISYLTRPKKRAYSAVQGQREYGARVPAWTLYGKGKVTGHHIFYAKWGSGNKFNADVLVLANGWCDGLEPEIYFYGEKHTLVERTIIDNEVAHYGVDGFDELISIRFYDGRPGQGVDTKLVSDTATLGQKWNSTSVCAGLTYVVVEREWNAEKFEKGQPEFEFILRGLRLYDPRQDSTVAGGSGSHRRDDPSTYEFGAIGQNPALQRLNYQLGLRGLVSGRTLIGEGKSLGQLDLGSYFVAMNVADTIREGMPTYQSSLLATSDDDHTEILKEFDDALAGYGMNRRGLSGIVPGAPQIPVADIGPDDIDMGRSKQIKLRKSAFELYNHISGQFTSPEANWNAESLDPIYVNADVAADGRVRQIANDFLQVTDPDIAQYLLQIRYRQNRKGGTATVPVSRRLGFKVLEGQWVTYAGRTWLITGWSSDAQLQVTLTLAETGADVYSSAGIQPGPIVIPSPPPINPGLLSTVQDFAVQVGMIEGGEGHEVPALRFTWTPPEDPTITAVRFEYFIGTVPSGQTVYADRTEDVERGEYITSKDVQPYAFYTARATIVTVPDRFKTWTPWYTTETPTGPIEVYPEGLMKEIGESFDDLQKFAGEGARNAREMMRRLAMYGLEQDGQNVLDKREITLAYSGELGQKADVSVVDALIGHVSDIDGELTLIGAAITDIQGAMTGYSGVGAIAAAFNGLSIQISEIDGELTALAEDLTLLETEVGDIASSVTVRSQAGSSPGAGWSRYVVEVKTETATWSGAVGLYMDVHTNGTRRLMADASQFVFGDLSGAAPLINPLIYADGAWRMNVAHIGTVTAGVLRHADGKFVIDLNNRFFEIWT